MTPRDTVPTEQAEVLSSHGDSAASKFLAEASKFAGAAKDSFLYSAAQSPVTGVTRRAGKIWLLRARFMPRNSVYGQRTRRLYQK